MGFIEFLAKLDWVEPLTVLLHTLEGTRQRKITIDRFCGFSGQEVEDMLNSYGVTLWGRGFTEDTLTFHVKEAQADWAMYLLTRNGIQAR